MIIQAKVRSIQFGWPFKMILMMAFAVRINPCDSVSEVVSVSPFILSGNLPE